MKIEFNHWDLVIAETKEGAEVVNIKGPVAFDPDFIEEMKSKGVKKFTEEEEQVEEN